MGCPHVVVVVVELAPAPESRPYFCASVWLASEPREELDGSAPAGLDFDDAALSLDHAIGRVECVEKVTANGTGWQFDFGHGCVFWFGFYRTRPKNGLGKKVCALYPHTPMHKMAQLAHPLAPCCFVRHLQVGARWRKMAQLAQVARHTTARIP